MRLLERQATVVRQCLVVRGERAVGDALALMAGVVAERDVAARERRGGGRRCHVERGKPGDERAVEAAAAILQRLLVPRTRQVDLEVDRPRATTDRPGRAGS